jgi:hypothetical protein
MGATASRTICGTPRKHSKRPRPRNRPRRDKQQRSAGVCTINRRQ